ncbi:STAS domain-containing protein [Nocardia sp. CDC160]|uniref:STAS domain-containing protein n=1 Tax=Nocardia sp. CDC160 TaxID=3112166 RepID=UPI002DB60405|nr:STAS domain-containing protein [Nocardia sp. CDC160]MEC3918996.1 STAS domain-containing protein [Nocardia sp. CDC160]
MPTISVVPSRLADEIPVAGAPPGSASDGDHAHRVGVGDCMVVQVDGELDITGLDSFQRALSFAIAGGAPTVVVDLRRTRFLSLRNACALAAAMDDAFDADIETRLLTGRRQIERALEVTGARARAHRTVTRRRREREKAAAQ